MTSNIKNCCICNDTFEGFGHNSIPLGKGRCCGFCNFSKVIPYRSKQIKKEFTERLIQNNKTNNKTNK